MYNNYPLKNNQAAKKGAALCIKARMKEVVKYRWWQKMAACDKSAANILVMIIQVNLCCLIQVLGTNFT